MATADVRLANEAWEALFRAEATLLQELTAGLARSGEVQSSEYSVLYALSAAPSGLRITELGEDVLITQAGMSRLVARLELRGFVERVDDPDDGRACLIRLTDAGAEVQRRVGTAHARQVAQVMNRALTREQLQTLRDLSRALLAAVPPRSRRRRTAGDQDR
jgi:DNA-binding MarR family transcriptional regulator